MQQDQLHRRLGFLYAKSPIPVAHSLPADGHVRCHSGSEALDAADSESQAASSSSNTGASRADSHSATRTHSTFWSAQSEESWSDVGSDGGFSDSGDDVPLRSEQRAVTSMAGSDERRDERKGPTPLEVLERLSGRTDGAAAREALVAVEAALEAAAEKVHEEWRAKKNAEMAALGITSPVPQWKRILPDEYEAWAAALPPEVVATVHRYSAPQPTNPSAPLDGQEEPGDNAVHWCDINQPYVYLPEQWKATNRQYAPSNILSNILSNNWMATNRQYAGPIASDSKLDPRAIAVIEAAFYRVFRRARHRTSHRASDRASH